MRIFHDTGDPAIADRVTLVLESWRGTPYLPGNKVKGMGVDCVQLVAGALGELCGRDVVIPRLPVDCAMHDDRMTQATLRKLLKAFPHVKLPVHTVMPGDVVLTYMGKPRGDNPPTHCMIVGGVPNTVYHAIQPNGVILSVLSNYSIHSIYRSKERETWVPIPSL